MLKQKRKVGCLSLEGKSLQKVETHDGLAVQLSGRNQWSVQKNIFIDLSQGDGLEEQLEFFTGSLFCQSPDEELGDLLPDVVLIVGGKKVEGFDVFVDCCNFQREVRDLVGHCCRVKPADGLKSCGR